MKKSFYISALSIFSLTLMGCSNNIAKVNGVEITKEDYQKTIEIIAATSGYVQGKSVEEIIETYRNESNENMKNEIVSFMVDNELLYQVAKDKASPPTNEEVNEKLQDVERSIDGNPSYKKKLEEIGVEKEYLEKEIYKDLTIQKYRNDYESKVSVSDEDIEKYYNVNNDKFKVEEINASHILISTLDENKKEISSDEKKQKYQLAVEILNKVKNGEDFSELAKKYSDDKLSGKYGGNLGYFSKNDMNVEFSNEAFKLSKGETSQIIETSYGYHIIRNNDKKIVTKELNQCREIIKENILNEKFIKHIEELKENAQIKR